jgi:hypothetical protein
MSPDRFRASSKPGTFCAGGRSTAHTNLPLNFIFAGGRKAPTYFPSYMKGFNSSTATPEERWAKARGVIVGTLTPVVVHQEAVAKLVDYQDILVSDTACFWQLVFGSGCTGRTIAAVS